jgi:hypothetical protein
MSNVSGYAHQQYAASLAEFGTPRRLEATGAWCLERVIPGTRSKDAMGCYPVFVASRWDRLEEDLETLSNDAVSFTAVCDPFGSYHRATIKDIFDVFRPYKQHVVANLHNLAPTAHHVRCTRTALRHVRVVEISTPLSFLDEWCGLYGFLIERHRLVGLQAFSRRAFAVQLAVPGVRVFGAVAGDEVVAAHVWYVSNGVAYSHLLASSERGYQVGAAYALYAEALDCLQGVAEWADLGGAAGSDGTEEDGLLRFKRGWSTHTRVAYLCGRILDAGRYKALTGTHPTTTGYFPAYRNGELTRSITQGTA